MVFSSFSFLAFFLPLVLIFNHRLPIKVSNVFLLLTSLLFYYIGEKELTLLLGASIMWNYLTGLLIAVFQSRVFLKKGVTAINIIGNVSVLIYYKYTAFIVQSLQLEEWFPPSSYNSIVLPIGISFFTFQGISYIIDIYRKPSEVEKNPINLGLYIALFPQLIAGPIIKYNEISYYLTKRFVNSTDTSKGIFKFIRGLFKKVILANSFAFFADYIFGMNYEEIPSLLAWFGVLNYSLQIYFDFSGYSDMAIGIGLMMGFHIPENFNYPYISKSIKEFWRRWHISLSSWFRDYLYIPLGGNRKGSVRTYLHLIIVFLVTGLWHGASYNFIIWGLLHGFFLILERLFPSSLSALGKMGQHLYTLLIVGVTWVFFRVTALDDALLYLQQMFSFQKMGDYGVCLYWTSYNSLLLVLAILLALRARLLLQEKMRSWTKARLSPSSSFLFTASFYLLLYVYTIVELSMSTYTPFIYFKF